jgi:hypothetical protein
MVSTLTGSWSFLEGVTFRTTVALMEAESRLSNSLRIVVADSCNADPEVVLLRETDVDVQVRVVASIGLSEAPTTAGLP